MIGGMFEPAGYELATSAPGTAAVKVPRIVTGRFRTLEEVSQVIAEGTADLVGMTRAHIADAAIVRKTREGREIGRASCRERVCQYGVDLGGRRIIKKKKTNVAGNRLMDDKMRQ